jgi:hypothetical protein
MSEVLNLKLRMYLVIALVFGIGFAILYAIMAYLGIGLIPIIMLAIGFFALQWYISPLIIKWSSKLRYLNENEHPELHSMVKVPVVVVEEEVMSVDVDEVEVVVEDEVVVVDVDMVVVVVDVVGSNVNVMLFWIEAYVAVIVTVPAVPPYSTEYA